MAANLDEGVPAPENKRFTTTRWSVVLAAGDRASAGSAKALAVLCETYWFPLYAYARRRVAGVDAAQDLTQAFFARVLEKNDLAAADPSRGKFRAYLLTAFKHFLSNEWEKARAQKRGGGTSPISLDFDSGEKRISLEPVDTLTPEQLFEREWVLTLLDRVLAAAGRIPPRQKDRAVRGVQTVHQQRRRTGGIRDRRRRIGDDRWGGKSGRASVAATLSETAAGGDRGNGGRSREHRRRNQPAFRGI